jgi:glutathione synthase
MNNSAQILFIMDPSHQLNLETETSLLLMQELLQRGQAVYWLQQEGLVLKQDQVMGKVQKVTGIEPLQRTEPVWTHLDLFDAVLVRKDPPFDTGFLQLTQMLDFLDPRVAQFNDVKALREFNEKILPLRWPEFTPPTLISMDAEQIAEFAEEHQSIVLKPLNDCSGRGILKIETDETGLFREQIKSTLLDSSGNSQYLTAQKFLPSVKQGDKRVYLLDGVPVGSVNRIPQAGAFLANIHQGARCGATELTDRESHIIESIAPFLRRKGILLAGADFIGNYLTELNITSPSAVRQINQVNEVSIHRTIVDAMLRKIGTEKCCGPGRKIIFLCCSDSNSPSVHGMHPSA